MNGQRFQRTVDELRAVGAMFWPTDLSAKEAELSIIPKLLETQDEFIAILSVKVENINDLFTIIEAATMPPNLFLKHLVVLADFGGEPIQRINTRFRELFPNGELTYVWQAEERAYGFAALPYMQRNGAKPAILSNEKLGISGNRLLEKQALTDLHRDVIALLILGAAAVSEEIAQVLAKCEISNYLGEPDKLEKFIKQRYIWVSRITGGAQANTLGQMAQNFVKEYLEENLQIPGILVQRESHLPNVAHADPQTGRLTSFDLVVSDGAKYVAIEVSFQVTTNSTIERKGGQARDRFLQVEAAGHKIAYVIGGAGNFQRETQLNNICSHSHCTVSFSKPELDVLCEFLRDFFQGNNQV